jgi:hypothetical protein
MEWNKLGLCYHAPSFQNHWRYASALTPTPIIHPEGHIRVFTSFRDQKGVGRIGYVDLDPSSPQRVLRVSTVPSLDIGKPGCFDDNGVILGDVIDVNGVLVMCYIGFQLVARAKFLAFSGLAVSENWGMSFSRVSNAPIFDRADSRITIAAIHSVVLENNTYRIWCSRGSDWEVIGGVSYPRYEICYLESTSLEKLDSPEIPCVTSVLDEYRVGRPRVVKLANGMYVMYFTSGTTGGSYRSATAVSVDGFNWTRTGNFGCLNLSESGWDSKHLCYPTLITHEQTNLMFYNGNNMGEDGFGVAEIPTVVFEKSWRQHLDSLRKTCT